MPSNHDDDVTCARTFRLRLAFTRSSHAHPRSRSPIHPRLHLHPYTLTSTPKGSGTVGDKIEDPSDQLILPGPTLPALPSVIHTAADRPRPSPVPSSLRLLPRTLTPVSRKADGHGRSDCSWPKGSSRDNSAATRTSRTASCSPLANLSSAHCHPLLLYLRSPPHLPPHRLHQRHLQQQHPVVTCSSMKDIYNASHASQFNTANNRAHDETTPSPAITRH